MAADEIARPVSCKVRAINPIISSPSSNDKLVPIAVNGLVASEPLEAP
jgi:hypothetical protein